MHIERRQTPRLAHAENHGSQGSWRHLWCQRHHAYRQGGPNDPHWRCRGRWSASGLSDEHLICSRSPSSSGSLPPSFSHSENKTRVFLHHLSLSPLPCRDAQHVSALISRRKCSGMTETSATLSRPAQPPASLLRLAHKLVHIQSSPDPASLARVCCDFATE